MNPTATGQVNDEEYRVAVDFFPEAISGQLCQMLGRRTMRQPDCHRLCSVQNENSKNCLKSG